MSMWTSFISIAGSETDTISRKMKEHSHTVANWDFDRFIPCHGVSNSLLLW